MFRTRETRLFFLSMAAILLIFIITVYDIVALRDLKTVLGSYLLLIPVGYLFTSVLFRRERHSIIERLLLSIVMSISIITLSLLFAYYVLSVVLCPGNNLAVIGVLLLIAYLAFLLPYKLPKRAKKATGGAEVA